MKWFFIIGGFLFLLWYFPMAVTDGKVTLIEAGAILINFVSIVVNLNNVFEGNDQAQKK